MNFKVGDPVMYAFPGYRKGTTSMYIIQRVANGLYYGRWELDRRVIKLLGDGKYLVPKEIYESPVWKLLNET